MKTFLTICTCAMVTAGIYGFTDMAIDVKNGTMIEYDHGDEADDISAAIADVKVHKEKKAETKVKVADVQAVKKESTATTKSKTKKKVVKKEASVVDENPVLEPVVIAEPQTDVKTDSTPQIIEDRGIDYREFSRGAPRKYKKSKKSKKE